MGKYKYIIFLTFLIFASVIMLNIFPSCESKKQIKIALSKGKGSEHYLRYAEWLRKFDSNLEFVDLYHIPLDSAVILLEQCSGLLVTGGPDVSPDRYGRPEAIDICEVDLKRDSLEFLIINKAIEKKIPILGVCRGQQILNVAMGGSLVPDIPSEFSSDIAHRMENPDSCKHTVNINKGTILQNISGIKSGEVNSNHHQAVAQIGSKFRISAFTPDGIIEAIELRDTNSVPSIIAVQWHPERMDTANPLSGAIAKYFLYKIHSNKGN